MPSLHWSNFVLRTDIYGVNIIFELLKYQLNNSYEKGTYKSFQRNKN